MSEWPLVPLRDLVTQHNPSEYTPDPGELVRFAGVRWYGEGLFVREERKGFEIKGKCFALKPGALVYNRLFAWKQSFANVGTEFGGVVVSNEFPQFDVDPDLATAQYLALYCSSPVFGNKAFALSTGSTAISRNRLKEADFLGMIVARPPVPVQRRIVEVMAAVDEYIEALAAEQAALATLLTELRQSLLAKFPRVPLGSVCEITAKLVDPRSDDYADLTHIGIDSIEKGTGRIVGARTAREDGVISGKYLVGENDVVYSKIRPSLRKAAFPGHIALCSADAYPLSPLNGTPPALLRELLLEHEFTAQAVALSTRLKMPKVNRRELFSTTVAMPSSEKEQAHVFETLEVVRAQLDASASELSGARTARLVLLQALLENKIQITLPSNNYTLADESETEL